MKLRGLQKYSKIRYSKTYLQGCITCNIFRGFFLVEILPLNDAINPPSRILCYIFKTATWEMLNNCSTV